MSPRHPPMKTRTSSQFFKAFSDVIHRSNSLSVLENASLFKLAFALSLSRGASLTLTMVAPLILFCLFTLTSGCSGARILGVFHTHSRSHHVIGSVILQELAKRGHYVKMVSPFPLAEAPANYSDVDLNEGSDVIKALNKDLVKEFNEKPLLQVFALLLNFTSQQTEAVFRSKAVQDLLKSGEEFDLVIMDWFFNEAHLIFGEIYDAPVIIVSSFGTSPNVNWIVGNPGPLAYVPAKGTPFNEDMGFFERLASVIVHLIGLGMMAVSQRGQQEMLRKYFDGPKGIGELATRVALVFSNEHYSFDQAKPSVPNIINIGGLHLQPPGKLPPDLQEFLDGAVEGAVFFSLGSNVQGVFLDEGKRNALLSAFGKSHFRILMKYEEDHLPNQPGNVKIAKWLPQNDILAHPNVKVFITHGGLLSVIEAVHNAVPIIGIPIFGDQTANVPRAVKAGFALQIDLKDITEGNVKASIEEIVSNPKYTESVRKRSQLLRQRPLKPLDEAVFWAEHVLEHKGADHLKNWSVKLTWYENMLLDVVAFALGVLLLVTTTIYFGVSRILRWCGRRRRGPVAPIKKDQ